MKLFCQMSALLVMSKSTEVPVWSRSLNLKKALGLLLLSKCLFISLITSQSTELNCFSPFSSQHIPLHVLTDWVSHLPDCLLADWKSRNLVRNLAKQEAGIQLDATNAVETATELKRKLMLHERLYEK